MIPHRRLLLSLAVLAMPALLVSATTRADGPADNNPATVRRVPALGIEVPEAQRRRLEAQLEQLNQAIDALRHAADPSVQQLLPDVQIYAKAVHDALTYQEFFDPKEIDVAFTLLDEGTQRAAQLAEGHAPWTTATGLVVRGYVSRIDGSVQPYGLVVPASYTAQGPTRHRLDIWFHGRGERLSELNFIQQRRNQVGQFAPQDTFLLHPYGRYCNAFKFAGEVDVLEALDACRRNYRIDDQRTSVRGFSMGGAACWQFAVHDADRWFAANPGAGFAETAEFLRFFQKETLEPTWYERKLWHMYDCTDYAANLLQCPTVAYSGELDTQKQAADIMAAALEKEGINLVHIIGPGTKHRYHPDAAATVEALVDSIAERGRRRVPRSVQLVTYTLKYNRMNWVTIDGMQEHWEKARVDADFRGASSVAVQTTNVTDLTLDMPAGWCPLDPRRPVQLEIDGQSLAAPRPGSDRSWHVQLYRLGDQWQLGPRTENGLRKRHDLQGPIDDAFMDSFVFVRPTGHSEHPAVDQWAASELDRAVEHWRRQFRGEPRVVDDTAVTDEQIASSNLVLWGDPGSNAVLHRIADRLPIRWQADQIAVAANTYPADHHALIMIYPNPLNPNRYIVLNSSFTYRDFAYLNNARQVPKLPDWAVVDLNTAPDSLWPGKIAAADFFDEHWQLRPPH